MIICLNCGNTNKFSRIALYKEWSEETQYLNGKEKDDYAYDFGPSEKVDSELLEYYDYTCEQCKSEKVEESLDEKQVLEIQIEHTDKKGKWHKDGVDEDNQNEEIKKKLFVIMV